MAGESIFAPVFEMNGDTWHLVYDPNCGVTPMPDLSRARVWPAVHGPVFVNGRQLYGVAFDLVIPGVSNGNMVSPERRLRAFRVFEIPPCKPEDTFPMQILKVSEMVYYAQAPKHDDGANVVQQFIMASLGNSATREEPQRVTWGQALVPSEEFGEGM